MLAHEEEVTMRRLLSFRVLVLVFLGSVVAVPRAGRATAGAELSPQAGKALQVLITTAELVVGQNRFAFGLLKEHQLLEDAHAVVRVYALEGQQGQLQTEVPASYARLEVVEQGNRVHVHPDGARHVHHEETDMRGIYVAQVSFERPGTWGLEVLATPGNGSTEVSRFTVKVLQGLCRKFCAGGREGAFAPGCGEIRRPGSRTVRPQ